MTFGSSYSRSRGEALEDLEMGGGSTLSLKVRPARLPGRGSLGAPVDVSRSSDAPGAQERPVVGPAHRGHAHMSDAPPDPGPFFHGTKVVLQPGDLLGPGYSSNYGNRARANFVYLSATLDAAIWGAELAAGEGPGRVYRVEPTGPFENDPNLTDQKFPGNPTRSYRTRAPLRVVGEVLAWEPHTPEALREMKEHLAELARRGIEAIND